MKDKLLHIESTDGILPLTSTLRFKANEENGMWTCQISFAAM